MGYSKIVKSQLNKFPDFIMNTNGAKIGVELEAILSSFVDHKHDPNKVDHIICMFRDVSFDPFEPIDWNYEIGETSKYLSRVIMADRERVINFYKKFHPEWVPMLKDLKVVVLDELDLEGIREIRETMLGVRTWGE